MCDADAHRVPGRRTTVEEDTVFELVLTIVVLLAVAAAILLFERPRAEQIERDLHEQAADRRDADRRDAAAPAPDAEQSPEQSPEQSAEQSAGQRPEPEDRPDDSR
jgi:hypothetical protein